MWSATEPEVAGNVRVLDGSTVTGDGFVFLQRADSGGTDTVTEADFYLDGRLLGTATAAPFETPLPLDGLGEGKHQLTAQVALGSETPAKATAQFVARALQEPAPPPEGGDDTGLEAPWQKRDIGAVGAPGEASSPGAASFEIAGSGADIWGQEDAFTFVYREMQGDGAVIARVTGLDASDEWAKAGVMLRESLDPGASNALVALTGGNRVTFQRRAAGGGNTVSTKLEEREAPQWLKLVRSGDLLEAYASTDGASWDYIGWDIVDMPETLLVGLAVTSHQKGVLAAASFDEVAVQGSTPAGPAGNQPAPGLSGIGFLGDSETELYYLVPGIDSRTVIPEPSRDMRYSTLVREALGVETDNYGRGGQTTAVFLRDDVMAEWKAGKHAYYVITFGINDAKVISPEEFKADTLQLIEEVRSIGAVPILVTNVNVDYPEHYTYDRNEIIQRYDDQYRALAAELGIGLIDVHKVFAAMNEAGDWDTRIRYTGNDDLIILDDSRDTPDKDVQWYTNIHYNVHGSETVAREIIDYFRRNGLQP